MQILTGWINGAAVSSTTAAVQLLIKSLETGARSLFLKARSHGECRVEWTCVARKRACPL